FGASGGTIVAGANGMLTTETTSPRVESAPTALRTSISSCASSAAVRGVAAAPVLLPAGGALSATITATVSRLIDPGEATNCSVLRVFSYVVDVVFCPAPPDEPG